MTSDDTAEIRFCDVTVAGQQSLPSGCLASSASSISYPESTGSLVSGASPGETLGQSNFCARNRGAAVVMRMLASKTEVKMLSQSASCRNGKKGHL